MIKFPKNLADTVHRNWNSIVGGEYIASCCPRKNLLKKLFEVCYISSCSAEEARFPSFNVIATPLDQTSGLEFAEGAWKFESKRRLDVGEIRRLAPAVDLKKSAIWVEWDDSDWFIKGLIDLGTSWYRARNGLGYNFKESKTLLVQIDRPGRLAVYQGRYHVATLVDGELEEN